MKNDRVHPGYIYLFACALYWAFPNVAMASGVDGMIRSAGKQLPAFLDFLMYLSYLLSAFIMVTTLYKLKVTVDAPMGVAAPSYMEIFLRFLASGAFAVLPFAAEMLIRTLGFSPQDGAALDTDINAGGTPSGLGLDAIAIKLMQAIYPPLKMVVPYACFVMGIIYTIIGIHRMTKGSDGSPRAPGGKGTLTTLATAAVLMSIGSAFNAVEFSLFGKNITSNHMILSYAGSNPATMAQLNAAIPALLMFCAVVGWIAFIRGFLMLRAAAEGMQASIAGGITHIVGGVMAANIAFVIDAIQTTLGLSIISVP